MMIVVGQNETPLACVITCGRELRVSKAFSSGHWNMPMWGQLPPPDQRAEGIGTAWGDAGSKTRHEIAKLLGKSVESESASPRYDASLLRYR
jgi:hypothetical protein